MARLRMAIGFALMVSLALPTVSANWPLGTGAFWDQVGARRCGADASSGFGNCSFGCGAGEAISVSGSAYLYRWNPTTQRYDYDSTSYYVTGSCDTASASCGSAQGSTCYSGSEHATAHPGGGSCRMGASGRQGWTLVASGWCGVPGESGPMHAICGAEVNALWPYDRDTAESIYDACTYTLYHFEITDPLCQRSCT